MPRCLGTGRMGRAMLAEGGGAVAALAGIVLVLVLSFPSLSRDLTSWGDRQGAWLAVRGDVPAPVTGGSVPERDGAPVLVKPRFQGSLFGKVLVGDPGWGPFPIFLDMGPADFVAIPETPSESSRLAPPTGQGTSRHPTGPPGL